MDKNLTRTMAAKQLGVTPMTISRMCLRKDIEFFRLGNGQLRIPEKALERYCRRRKNKKYSGKPRGLQPGQNPRDTWKPNGNGTAKTNPPGDHANADTAPQ